MHKRALVAGSRFVSSRGAGAASLDCAWVPGSHIRVLHLLDELEIPV